MQSSNQPKITKLPTQAQAQTQTPKGAVEANVETEESGVEPVTHVGLKVLHDITVAKKILQIHLSAKSRGIPFSLSFRKVKALMLQKRCYYTGTLFDKTPNNRLSFDRIDSAKGYTDDNVVACTVNVNNLKANMTSQEILRLALKLATPLVKAKLQAKKGVKKATRVSTVA